MKKLIFLLVFGMLFAACKDEQPLQEYMTKSWETSHINISMPTYQKSDSSYVYEDDFLNNPPRIAQSKYNKDGSFSAWYVDAKGVKQEETLGKWNVKGDSLYIQFEQRRKCKHYSADYGSIKIENLANGFESVTIDKTILLKTLDAEINAHVSELIHNYKIKVNDLQGVLRREKFTISVGDELPAGILKLAKVYIAKKRKLKVGDKIAGRH